jgi:uncharacterized protein
MRHLLPALWVFALLNSAGTLHAESTTVIGVLAGEEQWLPLASALAKRIDHEDGLRILPILGAGSLQALDDLSALPHVDAAIVTADSLAYAQRQKLAGGKVNYLARLGTANLVLVARQGVSNVTALAGKRIATGPAESAGFATGELLFNALEIPFLRVPLQGEKAVAALLSGKADAALVLADDIPKAALSDGPYRVLTLTVPPQLADVYQVATLTAQDLPGLLANNRSVDSIATTLVLAVVNWPHNSAHFAALQRFDAQLLKLHDAQDFSTDVQGWVRSAAATTPTTITPTGGEP